MKFCPECGNNIEGMKFCSNCGYKVDGGGADTASNKHESLNKEETITTFSTHLFGMEDKKQTIGGKVDLSLPRVNYTLTNQRILLERKNLTTKREEIELGDIVKIDVKQGLKEKVLKIGHIVLNLNDGREVVFKQLQNPYEIKDQIRAATQNYQTRSKIDYRVDL